MWHRRDIVQLLQRWLWIAALLLRNLQTCACTLLRQAFTLLQHRQQQQLAQTYEHPSRIIFLDHAAGAPASAAFAQQCVQMLTSSAVGATPRPAPTSSWRTKADTVAKGDGESAVQYDVAQEKSKESIGIANPHSQHPVAQHTQQLIDHVRNKVSGYSHHDDALEEPSLTAV